MNLIEQAKRYKEGAETLRDWLLGGAEIVDKGVAQNRASVCLSCPLNQDGLKIAETVSAQIRKQVELKKHLQLRVNGEKQLKTCAACLCPLRLKVWIPLALVLPDDEEKSKLDARCWLLNEKL